MTVSFHLAHSPMVSGIFGYNLPAAIVLVVSIVIGFLMVIVFGYTSDQKAIKHAKDQLKAHLLAVRLFQDQLGVVIRSYGGILAARVAISFLHSSLCSSSSFRLRS